MKVQSCYSLKYGVLQPGALVEWGIDAGYKFLLLADINSTGAVLSFVRSAQEMGALYNYKSFGEEDRSMGMHNPTYVVQLLMDSIASLDPAFSTANRPK